jgi:hypothetical protein
VSELLLTLARYSPAATENPSKLAVQTLSAVGQGLQAISGHPPHSSIGEIHREIRAGLSPPIRRNAEEGPRSPKDELTPDYLVRGGVTAGQRLSRPRLQLTDVLIILNYRRVPNIDLDEDSTMASKIEPEYVVQTLLAHPPKETLPYPLTAMSVDAEYTVYLNPMAIPLVSNEYDMHRTPPQGEFILVKKDEDNSFSVRIPRSTNHKWMPITAQEPVNGYDWIEVTSVFIR